ncbi:VOC family protein [Crocinitomix algicola]|uniref:VOC family protein n=1 Tax=Crocinitomix algicola TaxID=1740263 RepID=UPI000829E6B8|nr:VOC family protein [Crocinitomix algicola]
MKLGAFSISLAVKDIHASKAFYENFGFKEFRGNIDQKWLIMKNDTAVIGLFQGMFESNILTFNPGWDGDAQPLESFTDIREIQKMLKEKGVPLIKEVEKETTGPGSLTTVDPDGNPILIDQHR